MTATQAPTPGPLDSESVKLLVKGDLLRYDGHVVELDNSDTGEPLVLFKNGPALRVCPSACAFIGRPDADGWMPWSGGENPVPGQMVERKERSGDLVWCACLSDDLRWSHSGLDTDIIAFRLAPTAPVEASGSERDGLEKAAQIAGDAFWSLPMPKHWDRDKDEYTDWCAAQSKRVRAAIAALRPQPSGETRDAVARIIDPAAFLFKTDELMKGDTSQYDAFNKADRILALLSARPLALGGQQGVQERCQRCGGEVQGWLCQSCPAEFRENDDGHLVFDEDTTPARAEAQDEGAAGEREALALDRLANAAEVVRRLLHKTKEVQGPSFREAGISFSTAIDHARAVLRQRDALLAHPSPTPPPMKTGCGSRWRRWRKSRT